MKIIKNIPEFINYKIQSYESNNFNIKICTKTKDVLF